MHTTLAIDEMQALLARAEADGQSNAVLQKLRWFVAYAREGSVSAVCREFGIARTTFYRWLQRFDTANLRALDEHDIHSSFQKREKCDCFGCHCSAWMRTNRRKFFMALLVMSILGNIAAFLTLFFPSVASASNWNPTVLVNTESFNTISDSDPTSNIEMRFGDTLGEKLYFNRTTNQFQLSNSLSIDNNLNVTNTMSGNILQVTNEAGIGDSAQDARFYIKGGGVGQKFRYETSLSDYSLRIGGKFNGVADEVALTAGAGVEAHTADTNSAAWAVNFSGLDDRLTVSRGANNGQGNAVTWTEHLRMDATGDVGIGLGGADAQTKLEVGGTASGAHIHAEQTLTSSGQLVVEGNLTFGDALADTVTVNAGTWTFANDTNFALSGGVNGLSFDTSTLSIDATNNRVGIGTTAPDTALDVVGTMSGSALTGAGLVDCDTADTSKLLWDSTTGKFSCGTDQTGGGGSAPDTGIFIDTGPAAFADNDTTELFNDATKPNIVTDSTSATVLVSVHMHGIASNTANDAFLAARIVYTTDGNDPSCSTSTQLGEPMVGGFTTATTHPWQVSGTFLHNPGTAGTIKYTVCTSTVSAGTATDTPEDVRVSLVELGS